MRNYGPYFILLAAILWSTDALFRKPLTGVLDSTTIVLLEHLFGLGILIPLLIPRLRELKKLNSSDWFAVCAVGIGGSALATILFTSSFRYVNPSVAILLQKVQPLSAIIFAYVVLRERLNPRFWAWAVVAIASAYVISFPDLRIAWSFYDNGTRGIIFALSAAFLWGASTVFGRYAIKKISFVTMSALRFIVAVLTVTAIMAMKGTLGTVSSVNGESLLRIIAIVFMSGTIPILIYYKGLKTTRASVSTIVELAYPFSAVLFNWIFLHELLVWQQIVAGIVLVFAIFKVQQTNNAIPQKPQAISMPAATPKAG
ncbi:MAG: DMT family transporter [Candidatus Kerfeldbacteria bacterium]